MRGEAEDGSKDEAGRGNPEVDGTNGQPHGDSQRGEPTCEGKAGEGDAKRLPNNRGFRLLPFSNLPPQALQNKLDKCFTFVY